MRKSAQIVRGEIVADLDEDVNWHIDEVSKFSTSTTTANNKALLEISTPAFFIGRGGERGLSVVGVCVN